MKKLLISTLAVGALFAQNSNADLEAKIKKLEAEIQELKQIAVSNQKKVNPIAANNHIFFSFDLRTTYDKINQHTTSGYTYSPRANRNSDGSITADLTYKDSKTYKSNIFTNRIILTGVARPSENLKATLKIEANNIFGMNSESMYNPYQNISWIANESPDDTNVRVKEAFFNYHFGPDNGFMFSAGRRPATEGFPANLRENDPPTSPLAHLINMEFDGFSFEISNTIFSKISDTFSDLGTWMKFCFGRGYSSSKGKWPGDGSPAYSKDPLDNTDFGGFILVPYDDGQYSLWTETVWAKNLKGMNIISYTDSNHDGIPESITMKMDDLGNYFGFNAIFKANGIGDGINDYLDDTVAFISFALSQTKPKSGKQMLGSTDKKTGHSIWIGADMPGFEDGDRWGFNFVKGSKYWRSMTYGEDTLAGSIAAVRGKAYEIYYNKQIIPHLTAGLRATFFRYDYAGSEAFFGVKGNPDQQVYVDKASDIRAYIRYSF
jgi:hypothetical protein